MEIFGVFEALQIRVDFGSCNDDTLCKRMADLRRSRISREEVRYCNTSFIGYGQLKTQTIIDYIFDKINYELQWSNG